MKLRLATGAWYTPDFAAANPATRRIELHEVKGFWREAARVRIKVAAEAFPMFDFFVARLQKKAEGGAWIVEPLRAP